MAQVVGSRQLPQMRKWHACGYHLLWREGKSEKKRTVFQGECAVLATLILSWYVTVNAMMSKELLSPQWTCSVGWCSGTWLKEEQRVGWLSVGRKKTQKHNSPGQGNWGKGCYGLNIYVFLGSYVQYILWGYGTRGWGPERILAFATGIAPMKWLQGTNSLGSHGWSWPSDILPAFVSCMRALQAWATTLIYVVLEVEPRAPYMIGKSSTNWATPQLPENQLIFPATWVENVLPTWAWSSQPPELSAIRSCE